MAYDDFKEGCSVIKDYVDDQNKETAGKIPTKVSELTNDSKYATEGYVDTAIGQISQPTSLPQTYKKKAVTLATSGWAADNSLPLTFPIVADTTVHRIRGDFSMYRSITDKNKWNCTYEETVAGEIRTNKFSAANDIQQTTRNISVKFAWSSDSSVTIFIYDNYIEYTSKRGARITSLGVGPASAYIYTYTDADVKVNSEVRFTLDEANGKLAGQFGLKKTIDKEAGKLTFTADTLPTSAISGTLEIGETSTEGAAFVDGIATSVNGGEASSGGTVTSVSVKMNGSVKGTVTTSGTIDLGTVVTDISGKQDKITADNKLDVSLVNGLAAVATSGSYNDLSNKPTIPSSVTETTVSDWGFTKNTGTVTSVAVKMNGANKGTVTGSGTIDLGTVLTSWDDVGSEAVISIIGKALYPVGAIYMSTANVNPSTFIAGTTWVAWGSGRVPVGVDTSDTSFNTVEKTGGEKTHTLTESEMPAHKHTGTESTSLGNTKPQLGAPATVSKETIIADFTRTTEEVVIYESAATTPANNTLTVEHGITAGGGQPHSILQPYITCYMFKRTA